MAHSSPRVVWGHLGPRCSVEAWSGDQRKELASACQPQAHEAVQAESCETNSLWYLLGARAIVALHNYPAVTCRILQRGN